MVQRKHNEFQSIVLYYTKSNLNETTYRNQLTVNSPENRGRAAAINYCFVGLRPSLYVALQSNSVKTKILL